ncbi:MAG: TonB-dependent receptor plug protein [Flavipsychrobacter sp.]|nr:TonB-dependent receptor plug protein [Flavipsychrobacter sp.]
MKRIVLFILIALCHINTYAQTQSITGNVYDEASKAPLPGVTVVVVNSIPALGTATDDNGHFRIDSVKLGRVSLKFSYLSYEDQVVHDIVVTAGKEVNLNINMQEAVHKLKEYTISYDRSKDKNHTINDMALISARSFNVDETKRYAGSLGDPSRMVANFAGIVAGNDSRNDIVVRGNSPLGMLWRIEGMNVPNPNHFGTLNSTGGPVSMLNNNNIDKSDFFTGAFPAQYGNAMAGVFDMKLRNGNMNKGEYVAQIGFNGFEGGAEGPIGKKKQTSYLINYRYSTLGVFKALGLNLGTGTAVPVYQDANYKLVSNLSKKSKLSFFGILGDSKADFLGKDIDTTKPDLYGGNIYQNQRSQFRSTINGLIFDHQLSERSSVKLIAGYTTTYQHFTNDSISNIDASTYPYQYVNFETGKMSLQGTYSHKFSAKDNIQAGFFYENTSFKTIYKEMHPGQPDKIYEDQTGSMGLEQAFVQWKHRFSQGLSVVTGLHAQLLDMNSSFALEPRAALRYSFNSRNAFNIGYGMHSQTQNVYNYFVRTPTPTGVLHTNQDLNFTRSQHVIAGYDYNISSSMRVKLEAYYQMLDQVPVTNYASSYSALNSGADFGLDNYDSLTNTGSGTNTGAELTVEHFLKNGFYLLATASLINSKYKGSDGVERNTAFNTGHVVNLLAGKEFKLGKKGSVLALNIKLSNIGGRYLTPIDTAASRMQGSAVYQWDKAFSEKQKDYFRTDIKIAYRKEYKRSTLEVSIDLQNITNNKNIFNQTYDKRTNRIVNNYQQGFFPVPLIRYTF